MTTVVGQLRRRGADAGRKVGAPFGQLTSRWRSLPGFVIVGAQRAGTTSLYRYLVAHPDVGGVRLGKGVHYFDTSFGQPLSWYRGHFPLDPNRVPMVSGPKLVGEGSPYYMFHPYGPERIASTLPGVKVIAILRDPIERAHSQWVHETARGFETLPFEEALEAEDSRLGDCAVDLSRPDAQSFSHQHHSYVARGQYAEQVERLWSVFGQTNVLVLPSTRLFAEPAKVYAESLAFLALDTFTTEFEAHNARSYSKIEPALERRLADRFSESNEQLVSMLGRDFDFRRG